MSDLFHAATIEVAVPARVAFDYLADGIRQGEWTLGCWNRERVGDDLFRGRSLYDDTESYVRVLPRPELLLIDFEVGQSPDALVFRISIRLLERGPGASVVGLMAWRPAGQSDESWRRVQDVHRAEIHLIKSRLELG
jgi:hypothetical protein